MPVTTCPPEDCEPDQRVGQLVPSLLVPLKGERPTLSWRPPCFIATALLQHPCSCASKADGAAHNGAYLMS